MRDSFPAGVDAGTEPRSVIEIPTSVGGEKRQRTLLVPAKRSEEPENLRGLTNNEIQGAVVIEQYKAAIAQQEGAVAVTSQVRSQH